MKSLIALSCLFFSTMCFSADWGYAASSNDTSYWIDREFYKYDGKSNNVDIWTKSVTKKTEGSEFYTKTKSLNRYSCINKEYKNLAFIEYKEDGSVEFSSSKPDTTFSIIFPETVAEGLWEVACKSKGKGLRFNEYQKSFEDMSKLYIQQNS
ncbi:surface-adhesin E family protein [Acinetobacter junii]|uniref:surface-adhesin E family protein n=1 Tax=Acinetobacter junii TaxID=40215 RepID=UPI00301717F0